MEMKYVLFILWGIAGALVLCGGEVTKLEYALVWISLLLSYLV